MITFIRNLIHGIKLLSPFVGATLPLQFTRLVEKFDVVERVPAYVRIKV